MEKAKKKKTIKLILIIILGIILLVTTAGIVAVKTIENNLENLKTAEISAVDFSKFADGDYLGTYEATPISVKISITVKDKKVTEINLIEHKNGKGKKAEALIPQMIEKQTIKLDTISGATYSSIVILKAVEDAFK